VWVVDSRLFPLYLFLFSLMYIFVRREWDFICVVCVVDSRVFFLLLLAPLEDMSALGS
jgi:hypothetical protein